MAVYFTTTPILTEGEDLWFTVTRTGSDIGRTQNFSIDLETTGGMRPASTIDLSGNSFFFDGFVMEAGQTTFRRNLKGLVDGVREGDEYFNFKLNSPSDAFVINPFSSTTLQDATVPQITLTYADSRIEATEGQDLVIRMNLNSGAHSGFTYQPQFSNAFGNQFLQGDVVGAETRQNSILPSIYFAPGQTSAEIRLGTVRDGMRENDEAIQLMSGPRQDLLAQGVDLTVVGTPTVLIRDSESATASQNVSTNVVINGNNNVVNITNNNIINYGTIVWEGRSYYDVKGDNGANNLTGTDAADKLTGFEGNDDLKGGNGDDAVIGNQGDDKLAGGEGADNIWGGLGNDIIIGNQGNDILYGNDGADVLWGGFGDDMLINNQGNDIVYGNDGADTFVLSAGQDTFKDFSVGQLDKILVFGQSSEISYGQDSNGWAQIRRGDNVTTLEGVAFSSFDASQSVQFAG